MPSISSRLLVDAVLQVERMSFKEQERLADEIHDRQPNLFFSVLVLQRYGATLEQLEVVLELLFVFYEAMRASGTAWPVISEDIQDRCLQRISARVRFIEGLTPQQQTQPLWMPSQTIPSNTCWPTCSASSGITASWASRPRRKRC